jgi:hypothetical protein
MINTNTVEQIKKSPVEERIHIIELILQSLKSDLKTKVKSTEKTKFKQFKVRKFSLGEEVHVNRDELYAERGF